jgi:multicomponent Na+:H+ antiporter subunit D
MRKILSFHIVSQIGYMLLGLALFTPLALVGAIFYLVHHIIVKANLFLISGVARRLTGSFQLASIGGLYKASAPLAALFLVPALSLAGFPPLSGFWAKFILIKASLDTGAYLAAAVALIVGLLTVFSMSKIWAEAFWKPHPAGGALSLAQVDGRDRTAMMLPVVILAVLTVIIGLYPQPFVELAERAAAQLLDPNSYVEAVLEVLP